MGESFLTYKDKRWLWVGIVAAAALLASYEWYRRQVEPHGGTTVGLTYGILGTAVIVVLMCLGIRKRSYASRLGTVQGWTSAHVYLGLLTVLLIPLHAGFKFRLDIHTLAFALLCLVVFSGIIGIVLYRVVPARLTRFEAHMQADRVDKEIDSLLAEMRTLARTKTDAFVEVYQQEFDRLRSTSRTGWRLLLKGAPGDLIDEKTQELSRAVSKIPSSEHADFQALSRLVLQLAQLESTLAAQMRLKNALESWLYVHVPASFAMCVAVLVHILAVFYY